MNILIGVKRSIIIDDTYNSSPVALKSALETLKELKKKAANEYKEAFKDRTLNIRRFFYNYRSIPYIQRMIKSDFWLIEDALT